MDERGRHTVEMNKHGAYMSYLKMRFFPARVVRRHDATG
jgi:hypothetical protein